MFSELMGPPGGDPTSSQGLMTGRPDTLDRLMSAACDELRRIALRQLAGREGGGTLSNVTVRTVQRDWTRARMLLRRALEP